ncbi:MAG: AAA family ATPase [Bifidobacteriaceae bacterium]|jgi:hypothetical protein|nr:AAA family ATPase [Bifidobacteriaceae bacterium]
MRLKQVRLRDFRGVSDSTVDFADGVTVIEGPNEVGKSSVAEALFLVIDYKDTSTAAEVRRTKPVDRDAGPDVEVELLTGPYHLRYRKRWLKERLTVLTVDEPVNEQYTGLQAHERFLEILNQTVDVNLLRALTALQGASLAQPSLAHLSALQRALGDPDDAGHDAIMDRIEAEYVRYYTAKGGKPTGEYARCQERIAELDRQAEELRRSGEEVDAWVEEHARMSRRHDDLSVALGNAREELAACEEEERHVDVLRRASDRAEGALGEAGRVREDASLAVDARGRLVGEVAVRVARIEALITEVAAVAAAPRNAHRVRGDAETAWRAAQGVASDAREAARAAEAALQRHRDSVEVAELADRLTRARAADLRRAEAEAAIAAAAIDDAAVEDLARLDHKLQVAGSAREAAAARIVVRPLGDAQVTLDGSPLPARETHESAVLGPLRIAVDGVLEMEVHPGPPPADLARREKSAREALDKALAASGVASLDEARSTAARRRSAEAALRDATTALTHVLGGDAIVQLEKRLAVIEARLDREGGAGRGDAGQGDAGSSSESGRVVESREQTERDGGAGADTQSGQTKQSQTPDSAPPGAEAPEAEPANIERSGADAPSAKPRDRESALRAAADRARAAEGRAEEDLAPSEALRQRSEASATRAREAWAVADADLKHTREELKRIAADLTQARRAADDQALHTALAEAEAALSTAESLAAAARTELDALDAETLTMRLKNARELVDSTRAQRDDAAARIGELGALLDHATTQHIQDRKDTVDADLAAARTTHMRLDRAAGAARLLRATMLAHRAQAQQRYVAPFTEQIDRLGRAVFGKDFRAQVSSDLVIQTRTLGGRTVPFESLSAGAQEQLALIGRLACAALVDPADGAPVILDDALGFADPERLKALGVILNDVGHSAQVVLLTCQPQRFAALGGARVVHLQGR